MDGSQYSQLAPNAKPMHRRNFCRTTLAAATTVLAPRVFAGDTEAVDRMSRQSVLDTSMIDRPVKVKSLELLHVGDDFLVRARSVDGVEAITVPHASKMKICYPIFIENVAPFLVGKDARQLESLLWDLYRDSSNYKMQGLAFWVCVAAAEMALLELLGQTAQRPLADFFGGTHSRDVDVYFASGNRGNTPEQEVAYLQQLVADSGVRAIKFRLGGRMSRNVDSLPNRSEKLIPLVRETFGSSMTLYADANSSYESEQAIRVGRIMQEHDYGFFEEPCEFDDLWSTKRVTDELAIPIAGGEQEFSMNRWRWTIANRGVDIVQPDLHYGGGFIRATKVARMADAMRMTVVPHMSGGGLGHVEVVQFASFTPNIGPYMEFKGNANFPVACDDSSLTCDSGTVRCPSGPGLGVKIDLAFVAKAKPVG